MLTFKSFTALFFLVVSLSAVARETVGPAAGWTKDPIVATAATENVAYTFDLKPFVKNSEFGRLTFSLESGPAWLAISTTEGVLSGTPQKSDVGKSTSVVRVMNEFGSERTNVEITVVAATPKFGWSLNPIVFTALENQEISLSLVGYVLNPENEKVSFELIDGPNWAKLTTAGSFSAIAPSEALGSNLLKIRVSAESGKIGDGVLNLIVLGENQPPFWTQNAIDFTVKMNTMFKADLTPYVKVAGEDAVTFAKVSGPDWLTVGKFGEISGTPGNGTTGTNSFKINACSQHGCSPSQINVRVN